MWTRVMPWLGLGGLAVALVFMATQMSANPPADKAPPPAAQSGDPAPPPPKEGARGGPVAKEGAPADPMAGVKLANSRVTAVTIYSNSALVTREVEVPAGAGTVELTVTPLPPATVNSSLYTEGADGIRVLTTRFRSRAIFEDTRQDVRKLQDEIEQLQLAREKLEADVRANQADEKLLGRLENFTGVTTVQSTEKGSLNSDSAIAMTKYIMEVRAEKSKSLVALQQQIQANQKKLAFAQRQLNELATGTTRTERDAVIVVEKNNAAAGKVRLNYLVSSASWRPQYKLRAAKPSDPIQLEYLAAVIQHTGEDWSGVDIVLSTAQPTLNAGPPDLQTLQVTAAPIASVPPAARHQDMMEVEDQIRNLRAKAQKDFNERKQSTGAGLFNTAAALDQSWELLNPDAAMKRGCALAAREGPTVTYHLSTRLSVPSRNDEQMLEVTRMDMRPDYYYKAVPILTSQIYRLADLTNKSNYVLLPGEATMYQGSDFVGQMNLPLVAIGEQFTAGFGIDPQLQIQRQMIDKSRATQGANQALRFEYRILVSSYKNEKVKLQVWDRLPLADNESVGVSLLKTAPELSKDALYLREQRPTNLLRWDVQLDPTMNGEKAMAINYEFKLELDRQNTITSFRSAGVFGQPAANPAPGNPGAMVNFDREAIQAAMAKLSPDDRRLAEAQVFCAIDQDSPLGQMGPILKVMVKGQPVFLCCKGCEAEAKAHPDETLVKLQQLMKRKR